jgi:hypothetical protein
VEVTEAIIRAWMRTPVNKAELAGLSGVIDPVAIRRQAPAHVNRLAELSRSVGDAFARFAKAVPRTKQGVRHARQT